MEKLWAPVPAVKLMPPDTLEVPTVRAEVVPEKSVPAVLMVPDTTAGRATRVPNWGTPDWPLFDRTLVPMMEEGEAVASRLMRLLTSVVA